MSRRLVPVSVAAVAVVLVGVAFAALPPDPPRAPRAVVAAGDAYVLGAPALLAGPRIRNVYPSPDGPYVLVAREPEGTPQNIPTSGEAQLLLWNRVTGRVTPVWSEAFTPGSGGVVEDVDWLPGTTAALATVARVTIDPERGPTGMDRRLLLIDTRQARPRDLGRLGQGDQLMTGDTPFAVIHAGAPAPGTRPPEDAQQVKQTLRVVRADGTLGPPVSVPEGVTLLTYAGVNAEEAVFATRRGDKDPSTGRPQTIYFSIGLKDGALKELPVRPNLRQAGGATKVAERIAALPVRLRTHGAALRPGGNVEGPGEDRIHAAYLERGDKATGGPKDARALVAADADAVTLTTDGAAALYRTSAGALYAAPILKQPAEAFVGARREFWKAQTVSNAKQAALGILQYIQDYDESFPPAGDITGIINPYVKMPEVFQNPETGQAGFTYVHPGAATISGVKSVQTTVLGYLAGPGGRAVIYVDGHVGWEEQ